MVMTSPFCLGLRSQAILTAELDQFMGDLPVQARRSCCPRQPHTALAQQTTTRTICQSRVSAAQRGQLHSDAPRKIVLSTRAPERGPLEGVHGIAVPGTCISRLNQPSP